VPHSFAHFTNEWALRAALLAKRFHGTRLDLDWPFLIIDTHQTSLAKKIRSWGNSGTGSCEEIDEGTPQDTDFFTASCPQASPEGGAFNGGGPGNNQYSASFLGFQFNFTTGTVEFAPSKSFSFGAQFLVGGEVTFNSETFLQVSRANMACREQGGK
jgi:hypothetical protein